MKTSQKRAIWYQYRDLKIAYQKQLLTSFNLNNDFINYMRDKNNKYINLFRTIFLKKHLKNYSARVIQDKIYNSLINENNGGK